MNWGKSIVLAFVGFALFIGVLVTVCMKQEVNLVSSDYYQQELDYQHQIDRMENTAKLRELPSIMIVDNSLKLAYSHLGTVKSGVLKLTRASSARYDVSFPITENRDLSEINFPLNDLPHGRYKASFQWVMDEKEYYVDQPVDL